MKKIIICIIICIYGAYFTNASTIIIQGQVTNIQNGGGITNHTIYVSDSMNYYDTVMTTVNGYYYIAITGVIPNPNLNYFVSTKDCNNNLHYNFANSTDSVSIINFNICDSTLINCQNSFSYTHQNLLYSFFGLNVSTYPTNYFWSFGDGTGANGQNVNHTFQQPVSGVATYTVTLYTQTIFPTDTCFSQTSQIITIVGNTPIICGTVSTENSNLNGGSVFLYGINNPVGSCILIDTVDIDSSGFYYFNNFQESYTAYILKVTLPNNSPLNSLYIPTYYDSLYSWINSPPAFPVTNGTKYNIHLIPLLADSLQGTYTISGNVLQIGTKSTELSTISNIEVLLLNSNNRPLRLTKTDISGNYSFTNLSAGNYKVFVEITGKISNPAFLSLNNLNPYANNINFIVEGNSIALAVDDSYSLNSQISEVYPNPTKGDIFIDFSFQKYENINIVIFNQIGQVLQNYVIEVNAGNQHINLNTKELTNGFYTVKIINNNTFITIKKFIKIT